MALADFIRKARKAKGISQRQLSMLSGISNSEISRIEAGSRKSTSPDVLKALADPLGVSYEELMVEAGYLSAQVAEREVPSGVGKTLDDSGGWTGLPDHGETSSDSVSRARPSGFGDATLDRESDAWLYEISAEIRKFIRDEAARGCPYLKLAQGFSKRDLEPAEVDAIVKTWMNAKARYERENRPRK